VEVVEAVAAEREAAEREETSAALCCRPPHELAEVQRRSTGKKAAEEENAQSPTASTLPVEIVANVVEGVVAYHVTIWLLLV
jgi:hypothetical protein